MDTTVQRPHLSDVQQPALAVQEAAVDVSSITDRQEEVLGRRQRKKEASIRLCDYVTHTIQKRNPCTSSPPIP